MTVNRTPTPTLLPALRGEWIYFVTTFKSAQ